MTKRPYRYRYSRKVAGTDRDILSYVARSLLNDLAAQRSITYDVERRALLTIRNRGWVTGRFDDFTIAITPKGREALERDRVALHVRDQARLARSPSGLDDDQGP